ncbi:MAG TPA: hypothetical protein VE264_05425 [Nitrososphaera sp.]|nr:hypothetical protein [Nitrososphaera sp.]
MSAVTWIAIYVGFQLYYRGLTDVYTITGFKRATVDGYVISHKFLTRKIIF